MERLVSFINNCPICSNWRLSVVIVVCKGEQLSNIYPNSSPGVHPIEDIYTYIHTYALHLLFLFYYVHVRDRVCE